MGSDEVRRTAAQIQQIGDDVRGLAEQVLAAGTARWRSTAAEAFQRRLAEEVRLVRALASDLDAAAAAFVRHASAVDDAQARLGVGGRP